MKKKNDSKISKILWAIAPRFMAKRAYARAKGQFAQRMLLAASKDDNYRHWRTVEAGPNSFLDDRSAISARVNIFYYGNPFVRSAVDICVDKIAGAKP